MGLIQRNQHKTHAHPDARRPHILTMHLGLFLRVFEVPILYEGNSRLLLKPTTLPRKPAAQHKKSTFCRMWPPCEDIPVVPF